MYVFLCLSMLITLSKQQPAFIHISKKISIHPFLVRAMGIIIIVWFMSTADNSRNFSLKWKLKWTYRNTLQTSKLAFNPQRKQTQRIWKAIIKNRCYFFLRVPKCKEFRMCAAKDLNANSVRASMISFIQ